jgi:hypothetical protein
VKTPQIAVSDQQKPQAAITPEEQPVELLKPAQSDKCSKTISLFGDDLPDQEAPKPEKPKRKTKDDLAWEMLRIWNEVCGQDLAKARAISKERMKVMNETLSDILNDDLNVWRTICEKVMQDPWKLGKVKPKSGGKAWKCEFKWLIKPENALSTLEKDLDQFNGEEQGDDDNEDFIARLKREAAENTRRFHEENPGYRESFA